MSAETFPAQSYTHTGIQATSKHMAGMTNRQTAISKHTQTPVSTTNTYICTSMFKKTFKTHREKKRPRNTSTIDKNYTNSQTHSHKHRHRQTIYSGS